MKTCVVYAPRTHRLFDDALTIIRAAASVRWIVSDDEGAAVPIPDGDFVVSFLNPTILRGSILRKPNVNFHPAPPDYPGRGGKLRPLR
ncbi:MAG: hypothetical protein ACT4P2_05500 [Pseudomonadota bacterium]